MADAVVCTVRGDKDIMRQLTNLPRNIARRVLQKSANMAMKPVLAAARSNAPRKSGQLRRAIKSKTIKRNRRGDIGQRVLTADDWYKGDQFYGAFQEFGWHAGKRTKDVIRAAKLGQPDTRVFIEGTHFVEKAFQTKGDTALRIFLREVPRMIEQGVPLDRRGAHLRSGGGK